MNTPLHELTRSARNPVVVIVDDEEMVTSSLGAFLEWETDYQVMTFHSPIKALEALRDRPADIVIADFLMPEMNGLQFLANIKALYPDVPRILLTGYADKEHAIKAINEIGLFHYFEKPWDNEAIKLAIENGLENKTVKAVLEQKLRELDHVLLQRDTVTEQHKALRQELCLAQQVQQSMLPRISEQTDLRLAAQYLPALEIGGDFYDIQCLADDHIAILLADMTGHGVQAALSTVLLKLGFSPFAKTSVGPVEILNGINAILCKGLPKELPSSIFAAAAVVIIDTRTGYCRLANAGLPHPVHMKRASQKAERITGSGMVLGIFDDSFFVPAVEVELQLDEGDMLLLYTDGLSETINDEGELFEVGYIRRTMLKHADETGAGIIDRLVGAVKAFSKPDHEWDDLTLLSVERQGAGDREIGR